MSTALLLSLLLHALLLSLSLGGQGVGLPGLDLPWRERRLGADDLRVTLAPAPVRPTPAMVEPLAGPASPEPVAATEPAVLSEPAPISAPAPAPKLMTMARSDAASWAVAPAPVIIAAAASSAASPESLLEVPRDVAAAAQQQIALVAAQEAKERAQERAEEAARLARAEQEAQLAAAARLEAQRQQAAAAQAAATKAELDRAEAARVLAEAGRQETARQDAAKLAAANQAKAALIAERAEQDAKREAARRAMGRQLDEEAAKREATARQSPSSLLPGASSLRRGRLFGRSDPNAEMLLYAELWSRKIELNQTFDMIRAAVKQPHAQPLVTVAVRSDGSIESVSFVRSSGVAEIDAGIRRIVESQAPFPPFHPALAREFDVIEIRRSWVFDSAIRLY